MSQQQIHGSGDSGDSDDQSQDVGQVQINPADDLLDEIDGLLENNADEFVRSYVQKGGQ